MANTRIVAPVAASLLILPAAALLAYQVAQQNKLGRIAEPALPELAAGDRAASAHRSLLADPNAASGPVTRAGEAGKEVAARPLPEDARRNGEKGKAAPLSRDRPALTDNLAATAPPRSQAERDESFAQSRPVGGARPEERADGDDTTASSELAAIPQPAAPALMKQEGETERSGVVRTVRPPVETVSAPESSTDSFAAFNDNGIKIVKDEPVSTFSVDVDTASYAFVRRMLGSGSLPPPDAVRVEEMINYFSYDYPLPDDATTPFSTTVALYPTPWNTDTRLLHIGVKAYDVDADSRPASNLVFLIDVSGSMDSPDKLPLLKNAFRMLLGTLSPDDTVSIVTYAGHAGTVLEPTKVAERAKILHAIDVLRPGGSTAGAAGIEEAYRLAETARVEGGVNRVLLATDGDFNVGISDVGALKRFIEDKRKSGIFLSVLGFGQGNYQDGLMQALAQNGNGVAAYIDTLNEAQKVLVDEADAALFTVAKDVKVQIEFNPATVTEYRLIGYETRALNREDFNNDRVDAGDIGSGHAVTALYEITPAGSPAQLVDDLRYSDDALALRETQATDPDLAGEYAFLKLRYKLPDESQSRLITLPVTDAMESGSLAGEADDIRFAAAVAAFGQKLRGNRAVDNYGYEEIVRLANGARGADPFGYRGEFVSLVRLAASLDRN